MSVIAYDGKTLAADRMGVYENKIIIAEKIINKDGVVLAWTGAQEYGIALSEWYFGGHEPHEWPEFQKGDEWVRLIVYRNGCLGIFEQTPVFQEVVDKVMAWGCGSDLAIGAMLAGASAVDAVKIASEISPYCGKGVTSHELI